MKPAEFYTYTQPFVNLPAAGGNQQGIITFDASSDFVWMYSAFVALPHAGATNLTLNTMPTPPMTVMLTPGDTSAQMMNTATPMESIFGVGAGNQFFLPTPRTIPALSTLLIQVVNLDTAIAYDLWLSFIGIKRFKP